MSTAALGASMRPQLAAARAPGKSILDDVVAATVSRGGIDLDLLHVMDGADESLIGEEVVNGVKSGAFVYSFAISGSGTVSGISVVGAAHLARKYGGLKHRMIASVEKRGALHIFRSYPDNGSPMQVTTSILHDLEGDTDYYTAVVEMTDIKTGNSIQVEKTETRMERKRDGSTFERPHFQVIAQSKAYRNAVLRLVPQDIQRKFMTECIAQGNSKDMTDSAIDEKRRGVLAYAVKKGLPVTREGVFALGMAEISGLSDAAREDGVTAFVNGCKALGLLASDGSEAPPPPPPAPAAPKAKAEPKPAAAKPKAEPKPEQKPAPTSTPYDPETGEVLDEETDTRTTSAPDEDDDLFTAT